MRAKGELVKCERCGTETFRELTNTTVLDGGYTKSNVFAPIPEGWSTHHGVGDLCPSCSEHYDYILKRFLSGYRWGD